MSQSWVYFATILCIYYVLGAHDAEMHKKNTNFLIRGALCCYTNI